MLVVVVVVVVVVVILTTTRLYTRNINSKFNTALYAHNIICHKPV